MSATGGMGCLVVQDGEARYPWEDELEKTLRCHCRFVMRSRAHCEEALSAFAEMNRQGMDVVSVGIGKGAVQAAAIAARLPAAGLIVLGSPFAGGLRGALCSMEEKRTCRQLFAVVCPVLIVHPMADKQFAAGSGERLAHALTGAKDIETHFLSETSMETLWDSQERTMPEMFKSFFASVSGENHLRK